MSSRVTKNAITNIALAVLPASLSVIAFGQKPQSAPSPAALKQFESKVRPVLIESCNPCHSKGNIQGGFRLDIAVPAEKLNEIIVRVKGEGGKPKMPQNGSLSPEKIAALEEWVKAGGVWPSGSVVAPQTLAERGKSHWAFQPLKTQKVPALQSSWIRNPIDAFVLKGLRAKGLKPSATATRRELIRRLTYDLTGLPPTPEETLAYENDKDPKAYENLVDRLLASPHYGEKWGRHWLDLVRFAETNSYERDNPKPYAFKYRDYVIRAFNNDKPYDRFVKEQIAGDEIPNADGDCYAATGFYRLGIWDDEPADKLQALFDDYDDLITTTSQAFMGVTLDCSRCHDHKLDPFLQTDYYRLLAVFRNINRFRNGGSTDEAIYFPSTEAKRDYEARMAELKSRRAEFLTKVQTVEKKLEAKGKAVYNPADVVDMGYRYYERDWKRIPDFENEPTIASGSLKPAMLSIRPRERNEEFSLQFDGNINVEKEGDYTFYFQAEGGYRFSVAGEKLHESFASDGKAILKSAKKHLGPGKHGVSLTYNQRQRQHGFAISWSGPGFARRPLSSLDSCGLDGLPVLFGDDYKKLFAEIGESDFEQVVNNQAKLEQQSPFTEKVLCVTEAGKNIPETTVLLRGVPTAKGPAVTPGFPGCIGGVQATCTAPASGKSTGLRTELANWLTSPSHPLTARVIVNRVWQNHFGRGIVRTPNDFGLQGQKPTHPELLDWLAREFIQQGWSFKKLHRMILTSNTYKQSSRGNKEGLAADPQNDLLWRFDMRRLTAEEIRDSLLAVCGNINLKMYGPSVYPDIPKEILAAQSRPGKDWFTERMTPEDVCRRSIYISVKRSLIYPFFASFDLPETDRTAPMRFASTQPTQALSLLNGPLVNKQAAILADRVRKETGSDTKLFATRMLALVTQHAPRETDIQECVKLYSRLLKKNLKPEQAQNYLCLLALNTNEFFYLD